MSELLLQHDEHKARQIRLRAKEKPFSYYWKKETKTPRVRPINPAPFYPGMWFWELVVLTPKPVVSPPKMREILQRVSEHYGIPIDLICSPRMFAQLLRPRHVAMYLAHRLTHLSTPHIGRLIGGRDHSTVINGIRRIEHLLLTSTEVQRDVEALTERLTLK